MRWIIENSHGYPLKNLKILLPSENSSAACSQGKLITKTSSSKVVTKSPTFLKRIEGDICGHIHSPCKPFRCFMVLIDATSKWSHVCLPSSQNVAFARLIAYITRLRAQFPNYLIKKIRLNNVGEFTSQAFDNFCISIRIDVEHPIAHIHT